MPGFLRQLCWHNAFYWAALFMSHAVFLRVEINRLQTHTAPIPHCLFIPTLSFLPTLAFVLLTNQLSCSGPVINYQRILHTYIYIIFTHRHTYTCTVTCWAMLWFPAASKCLCSSHLIPAIIQHFCIDWQMWRASYKLSLFFVLSLMFCCFIVYVQKWLWSPGSVCVTSFFSCPCFCVLLSVDSLTKHDVPDSW